MNLPNYFLADLPPEATFTPSMIGEACQTLKKNREQYLAGRTTAHLIKTLAAAAEAWLDPEYPFRKHALEQGPAATGFPSATLARGLDAFFSQLTPDQFKALLVQEFGHAQRLDELIGSAGHESAHPALARGPEFMVHITAGNIPSPTLQSMVLGLLTRSAQFVKCARGTTFLPRLFAHSLYDADPKLAACLEIAEWPGGNRALEEMLFAEADIVTVTGTDETLNDIRARLPGTARFLGYGHRVSFGYVTHEVLTNYGVKKIVAHAADDLVAWNQLGCLSPHVLYLEHGGAVSGEQFSEMLAAELARRETTEPRGALSMEESAVIAARRDFYAVRAASSADTRLWQSDASTAWTVVYENDHRFQTSCGNRFLYVKTVTDLDDALHGVDPVRGQVSTVGLAAPEDLAAKLAMQLARWGVARICPLGRMQSPPLTWRHDGRPVLGDLVTWSDWEH